jgi:hypothetical protein
VLRYALDHGCPMSEQDLEACRVDASRHGHAEVVEYLRTAQPNEEEEEIEEDSDNLLTIIKIF